VWRGCCVGVVCLVFGTRGLATDARVY